MLSPSLIAARSITSSSFVHDRRSRTRMLSDPKTLKCGKKVMESIQENKRHTGTTFCKKKMSWTQRCGRLCKDQNWMSPPIKGVSHVTPNGENWRPRHRSTFCLKHGTATVYCKYNGVVRLDRYRRAGTVLRKRLKKKTKINRTAGNGPGRVSLGDKGENSSY